MRRKSLFSIGILIMMLLVLATPAHATLPTQAYGCAKNAVLTYGHVTEHSSYQHEVVWQTPEVKITYRLVHGFNGDTEYVIVRLQPSGDLVGRWVDGNNTHWVDDPIWGFICGV